MNFNIFEHGKIYHNPHSFFRYCGWPSICKDEEGTLYAVCSGFRVAHICPFGKTVLFKSFDDGKTWSIPMVINDTYSDDRDAGIICLGEKTMLVSWFSHPTEVYITQYKEGIMNSWHGSASVLDMYDTIPAEHGKGGSFIRISRDGGFSWGKTVKVPVSTPHGPILKKDGKILYFGKEHYSAGEETPHAVSAWESSDKGITWSKLCELKLPEGTQLDNFHEPHAVELSDGRILGMIRAQNMKTDPSFTMYKTYSNDGGKTWSECKPMGISGSPPHLLRHSSGAIILTYARREAPYSERAVISYDEGESWSEELILSEAKSSDIGYPSSAELSDGSILTVYYQQHENDNFPSLLYTKWTIFD